MYSNLNHISKIFVENVKQTNIFSQLPEITQNIKIDYFWEVTFGPKLTVTCRKSDRGNVKILYLVNNIKPEEILGYIDIKSQILKEGDFVFENNDEAGGIKVFYCVYVSEHLIVPNSTEIVEILDRIGAEIKALSNLGSTNSNVLSLGKSNYTTLIDGNNGK